MTVSLSGRTGSASGSGSVPRDYLLDVGDLDDLELRSLDVGHRSGALPRQAAQLLGALDRDLAGGLRQPRRQLDPEDAVLVGGLSVLGVDVHRELDDAPEGPEGSSTCW